MVNEDGAKSGPSPKNDFASFTKKPAEKQDEQVEELQEQLAKEKDARKEERFFGVLLLIILLDVVFFTVMPTFGGPIALLVLELLILLPLAKRMGMQEIAETLSRVLHRVSDGVKHEE